MNSTNNLLISYKNIIENNEKNKTMFFKMLLKIHTEVYNDYKNCFKNPLKSETENHKQFYNECMKLFTSKVLLLNSFLKRNKENIIKNFNNYNQCQLDYMECLEENDNNDEFYIDEDGIEIKAGEKYRLDCIEIKNNYELYKYIIETDYN